MLIVRLLQSYSTTWFVHSLTYLFRLNIKQPPNTTILPWYWIAEWH